MANESKVAIEANADFVSKNFANNLASERRDKVTCGTFIRVCVCPPGDQKTFPSPQWPRAKSISGGPLSVALPSCPL